MHHYRVFGGVLRSDFEIQELPIVTPVPPTWTLTSTQGEPPAGDGELLGSDAVIQDVKVSMYRQSAGFRLVFDDTGTFDVSPAGDVIRWTRRPGTSEADARADLTGRVLAAALHAAGTLCLHGSAVEHDGEAIGFIAPKFHGKSTLALALAGAGAKLLTDDTLPVLPGAPAMARPGLHAARLWPDSAERVGLGRARAAADGEKRLFDSLPDDHVTHDTVPLGALYLLGPTREAREGAAAWRTQLTPTESTLVLIAHAKLAPLLGKSEAPVLFRRAAEVAGSVPVYRLNILRDMSRLDEVVELIRSWHVQSQAASS